MGGMSNIRDSVTPKTTILLKLQDLKLKGMGLAVSVSHTELM